MARRSRIFIGVIAICSISSSAICRAQTTNVTNITPSGLNTRVANPTTNPNITGGTRPGGAAGTNLFHSFGEFSVATNNIATFLNSGSVDLAGNSLSAGLPTSNILGRVTGGKLSSIFGTIDTATNFGNANLYLINPAGILFGPTASLNVGGSFNASTADYIKMANGEKFYANSSPPPLLSFEPTAFGFLGGNPGGTITIQGGTVNNSSTLTLVGRDLVNSSGSTTTPGINFTGGTLSNSGGGINLVSVKTPQDTVAGGEILFSDLTPASTYGFSTLGTVQLDSGGILKTTSTTTDAGSIFVRAGDLVMDHARMDARTISSGDPFEGSSRGGNVDIQSSTVKLIAGISTVEESVRGQEVVTTTIATNNAGDITIHALNVTLDNAVLRTDIYPDAMTQISGGVRGDINIQGITDANSLVSQVTIVNNSEIQAAGVNGAMFTASAGAIRVRSDQITLGSSVIRNLIGEGINLFGTSGVYSLGHNTISSTAVDPTGAPTGSGPINIGSGGKVELRTGDNVITNIDIGPSIDLPRGPDVTINAPVIDIRGTSISTSSQFLVPSGAINLLGDSIYVANAKFTTNSFGFDVPIQFALSGAAGDILIAGSDGASKARTIELVSSHLSSEVKGPLGRTDLQFGYSGIVTLKGHTVTLDGTEVSVKHPGQGKGGAIIVDSGQFTMLSGPLLTSSTSGFDNSFSPAAAGGDISINAAGMIDIASGSSIQATSSGDGNAGDITLTSGGDITVRQSTFATSSSGEKTSGGNIKLTAPNLVRIVDSTITSSVKGQAGTSNGGNIDIDPQVVVIQNSNLTANANAGAGGNINIAALGAVLVDPNSLLSATAGPAGVSGSVNISSPIQVLSGALVPMKLAYTQTGLSSDRCAADPNGQFNSFVQTGRDGAPQTPGGFASSPLGFLDAFQTSSLDSDRPITQTARLGLSNVVGQTPVTVHFFSGCRS